MSNADSDEESVVINKGYLEECMYVKCPGFSADKQAHGKGANPPNLNRKLQASAPLKEPYPTATNKYRYGLEPSP